MANIRQYIGARYVIKIYENSTDPSSAEWEQANFEPLVMVTWQNGSYLSKKDVPASVGNPANNPTYWVQTGFYNGQIASLQAQIDAIVNNELPPITSQIQTLTDDVSSLDGRVDTLEEWEDVIGAIRKNSSTGEWEMITDATHQPQHIDSVEINSDNGMLQINFDKTYTEIGAGYVNCDETYAVEGFTAGISISAGFARVNMARTRPLTGVIAINGTSASLLSGYQGDLKTVSYDSTNNFFEITFQDYALANENITCDVRALGNNSALVALNWNVSFAGANKIRIFPTSDLTGLSGNLMITLNKQGACNFENMPAETNTNLWIHCKMKV